MLASPQTVTVNTVANTLNRIESEKTNSIYSTDDTTLKLKVSHQLTKTRSRHMCRLDQTIIATDPLTSENDYQSASAYIVVDEPLYGFTDTQLGYLVTALKDWLSTATVSAVLASRH